MRMRIALSLLAMLVASGCNSGETPTPIPSNTPTPSAQDGEPIHDNEDPPPAAPAASDPSTSDKTPPPEVSAPAPAADEPAPQPSSDAATSTEPQPASPSSPPADQPASSDPAKLVEQLSDANERDVVTRELVAIGPAAVDPLIGALGSDSWEIRASAVFCLGQLGDAARSALPRLKEISLQDEVPAVRDAAAFAIDSIDQTQ